MKLRKTYISCNDIKDSARLHKKISLKGREMFVDCCCVGGSEKINVYGINKFKGLLLSKHKNKLYVKITNI